MVNFIEKFVNALTIKLIEHTHQRKEENNMATIKRSTATSTESLHKFKKLCPSEYIPSTYTNSSNSLMYNPDDQPVFCINDLVYEKSIEVPLILKPLIDSVVFQRLRLIKQLGPAESVYPGATHTRFAHCLGTFHIAASFMTALRRRYPDRVTGIDHLCVSIAALYHDIGHGPFSHLFERVWTENNYHHEDMSVTLFDYVIAQLKEENAVLIKYLSEQDLQFIREAINPPKKDPNNNWIMKGRPEQKAFLYDIVNNTNSGLDVDKMDYILRDSKHANIGMRFQLSALDRIIKSMSIHEENGRTELCFHLKAYSDIKTLFEDRERMHQRVYRHRTVLAIEYEIKKALRLAGPHLMIPGKYGPVALKDSTKDIEAFLRLDDYITTAISHSNDPNLSAAATILNQVRKRQLMPCVAIVEIAKDVINETKLNAYIQKKLPEFAEKYYLTSCSFHGGLGVGRDPMSKIKFIGRNGEARCVPNEWQHSIWWYVFVSHEAAKEHDKFHVILDVLKSFCAKEKIDADICAMYKRHEDIENDVPIF